MEPINIMVLGVSGAGKTVYLASLYQSLSVQKNDSCYALVATKGADAAGLTKAYALVRDPSQEWPRGTRSVDYKDIQFDCVVNNKHGQRFTVMRLLYLDYAGGVLGGDVEDDKFFARLAKSDAFLVLIDGVKVLKALAGDAAAQEQLENDLDAVLGHVQSHIQKPLHFVLTKWDLLQDRHSLQEVVGLLGGCPKFQGILDQRRSGRTVTRLIPVSAVGKGFAELSPEGQMRKRRGAKARPENVDLPISCLLYDMISTAKSKIEDERLRLSLLSRLWYRTVGSSSLLISVGKIIVNKLPIPVAPDLVKYVLNSVLSGLHDVAGHSAESMREKFGLAVVEAESVGDAFTAMVKFHGHEVYWLKKQFPASSLSEAARA